jgi:hypothetical protein
MRGGRENSGDSSGGLAGWPCLGRSCSRPCGNGCARRGGARRRRHRGGDRRTGCDGHRGCSAGRHGCAAAGHAAALGRSDSSADGYTCGGACSRLGRRGPRCRCDRIGRISLLACRSSPSALLPVTPPLPSSQWPGTVTVAVVGLTRDTRICCAAPPRTPTARRFRVAAAATIPPATSMAAAGVVAVALASPVRAVDRRRLRIPMGFGEGWLGVPALRSTLRRSGCLTAAAAAGATGTGPAEPSAAAAAGSMKAAGRGQVLEGASPLEGAPATPFTVSSSSSSASSSAAAAAAAAAR